MSAIERIRGSLATRVDFYGVLHPGYFEIRNVPAPINMSEVAVLVPVVALIVVVSGMFALGVIA